MSGTIVAGYDDIVGLDVTHPRRRRFMEQLAGIPLDRPRLPSGLVPFARLPPPEPPTNVRTRMAAEIARAVAANGCVTRDELEAAGFTAPEIARHFTDARRAARVERMVA